MKSPYWHVQPLSRPRSSPCRIWSPSHYSSEPSHPVRLPRGSLPLVEPLPWDEAAGGRGGSWLATTLLPVRLLRPSLSGPLLCVSCPVWLLWPVLDSPLRLRLAGWYLGFWIFGWLVLGINKFPTSFIKAVKPEQSSKFLVVKDNIQDKIPTSFGKGC